MRNDIATPSIGAAPKLYDQQFFYRSHRDLEIFLQKLLSKGPVTVSSLTANSITVSSLTIPITGLINYADDTAAAAGGVPVGGIYRTASALKVRVT